MVWLDQGLNPGLPDHWSTLFSLGKKKKKIIVMNESWKFFTFNESHIWILIKFHWVITEPKFSFLQHFEFSVESELCRNWIADLLKSDWYAECYWISGATYQRKSKFLIKRSSTRHKFNFVLPRVIPDLKVKMKYCS